MDSKTPDTHDAQLNLSMEKNGANPLVHQIIKFGLTGMANVGIDLSVYILLLHLGLEIWLAKTFAFIVGTIFAYLVNKKWTFNDASGSHRKIFAVFTLYIFAMIINVGLNSFCISILGDNLAGKIIAYIFAVIPSAAVNFLGMKYIFRVSKSTQTEGL
ncbi:GtrA family protein [Hirschia baltica]|uniref:GtrA family protein n=1 Tax=Hirschia baltica (strain ATCC 49814 / DSM 5838 / IFAM 1418) TaxID=582402 RepID=C6XS38_HIRBI|nr:GtrA family protein [Hirschia baltica]ACT60879.1 GtrA family protein [Hirschia baltica ATCC 49814]